LTQRASSELPSHHIFLFARDLFGRTVAGKPGRIDGGRNGTLTIACCCRAGAWSRKDQESGGVGTKSPITPQFGQI
jgi:hypothetical protein